MESQINQPGYANSVSPDEMLALPSTNPENIPLLPPASETQMQRVGRQTSEFLADLPGNIGRFFSNYQPQITNVLLVIAAIITLKVVLAILDAVNDIPLLGPSFELVGLGYGAWFTNRYLLKTTTREELGAKVNSIKAEIFGS